MTHKNQNDELEKRMLKKESWDLPHIDAEIYIAEVINNIAKCALTWPERNIEYMTDEDLDLLANPQGHRPMNRPVVETAGPLIHFYKKLDREYESHAEINDEVVFLKETLETAQTALDTRQIDDLLDAIEALMDGFSFMVAPDVSGMTNLDNWVAVIDQPSSYSGKQEDEKQEIFTVVALAIRTLAERLCKLIAEEPLALQQVEWRHLEYIIATALEEIGFQVKLTPSTKDGGKDVVASCRVRGHELVFYVEIKHWRSGKRVGSKTIFDFVEVNMFDCTNGGLFISSSGFTQSAYSQLAEISRQRIRLANEEKIVSLCQHFVRKQRGIWKPVQSLPQILFEKSI